MWALLIIISIVHDSLESHHTCVVHCESRFFVVVIALELDIGVARVGFQFAVVELQVVAGCASVRLRVAYFVGLVLVGGQVESFDEQAAIISFEVQSEPPQRADETVSWFENGVALVVHPGEDARLNCDQEHYPD